uniref:gasdermin-A-like n=1 Tax=Pristiophorus japonicus TaxID=55135 RepID=UPI00398F6016
MFKKAVLQLIKHLDSGGELIAATSLCDSEKFKPLHLVYRKTGGPFWRKPKYGSTDFELKQILVGEDNLVPVYQNDMSFQFSETVDGSIKGKGNLKVDPLEANVAFRKADCKTIQLQGTKQFYVSISDLAESLKKRKIGKSWELVKNNYSENLCVVTETLMSAERITLQKVNKKGSEWYITAPYVSKAGTEYDIEKKNTLDVHEGVVLAYKVWALTITEDDTLCLSKPTKKSLPKSWLCLDNIDGEEGFEICSELKCLENVLKVQLLDLTCRIIEDATLHSVLSDLLCDACAGIEYKLSDLNELDKEGKKCAETLLGIWSEDQLKNAVDNQLLKAICLLIAALEDLSRPTLELLVQSLKMQILPQQLEMVTGIFKDLECSQVGQVVKVDTRDLPEDMFGITAKILNEIGIQLEREGVQKKRETNMCELSIALHCLDALSSQ